MGEPTKCLACGSEIPADAPGGACPRCALGAALPSSPPVPTADEVAAKLPGYDILGVLGRGGMGVVFKARQKALDRIVALKVLPPAMAAAPGFSERFVREAKAMARLAHPNIVAVHEFGESGGLFYLVLEYVDGVNVREAMRTGAIAPKDALAIVPQICDALQYAHDRGVVHRDVKPENVLIARDGRVKIADFGLAKLADREIGDVSLTGASQVMGTLHYMAPEQWERPKEVDHRADIYSLGVVFYEMLTGELPVGKFEPPSKKAQIDVRVDEVVMRSIERDRERRWQRADEMKTHVSALSSPAGAPPAVPETAPPVADFEDVLLSPGVAAVILLVFAAIAAAGALLSEMTWIWWLVPGALFASITCGIVWLARRPKGGTKTARLHVVVKAEKSDEPDLPMSAWLPTRAIALVTLACIALAAVVCGGFDRGPGGTAFQGAAVGLGFVLWWICDDRKDAVVEAQKGKGPAPGAPVAIEIVAGVTILIGVVCLGWALFGRMPAIKRDIAARSETATSEDDSSEEASQDDRAPWEFEMSFAPGEDPKHVPTEADRKEVWELWSKAQALQGDEYSTELTDLYDFDERSLVQTLDVDKVAERGASGALGLPALPKKSADLAKFRVEAVRFGSWLLNGDKGGFTAAVVRATDGARTLRFSVRRRQVGGLWGFAVAPVELK